MTHVFGLYNMNKDYLVSLRVTLASCKCWFTPSHALSRIYWQKPRCPFWRSSDFFIKNFEVQCEPQTRNRRVDFKKITLNLVTLFKIALLDNVTKFTVYFLKSSLRFLVDGSHWTSKKDLKSLTNVKKDTLVVLLATTLKSIKKICHS